MDINYAFLATNILSILLTLGVPIALAVVLIRRYKVSWLVVVTGLLAFVAAQVMFYFAIRYLSGVLQNTALFKGNSIWALVLYALLIGVLSAIFVELMRLAGFMLLKRKSKSFTSALGFGVGGGAFSGAANSFFNGGIGLNILIYFFIAITFNPGAMLAKGVDTATVTAAMSQVQQIWGAPWDYGLILGVESLIMLAAEIVLATFVWKSVAYGQGVWFAVAFLYRTLLIGAIYFLNMIGWNVWWIEAVLAAVLALNIYLIYTFWKEESAIEEDEEFAEIDDESDDEDFGVDDEDTDEIAEVIDQPVDDQDEIKAE